MWDDYNGSDWGMHGGMAWGGWLFMSLLFILLMALLVGVVYALLGGSSNDTGRRPTAGRGPDVADQVLKERYARGEIDDDEYRHRHGVLHSG